MVKLNTPIRTLATVCSAAVLSMGTTACMGGSSLNMTPATMQTEMGLNAFSSAVSMGEIEEAQLALSRSQNAQVREFAQQMITDHTLALRQEALVMDAVSMNMGMGSAGMAAMTTGNMDMGRMRTMLTNNPASRPVVEDHMRAMQMLQGMNGMQFDQAYMMRQVAAHTYALGEMDRMMGMMGLTGMASGGMSASGSGSTRTSVSAGGSAGATTGMGNGAAASVGLVGGDASVGGSSARMPAAMAVTRESVMLMHQNEREMVAMHLQMAQRMQAGMR
jgi:predicted outer membrane protein